MNIQIQKNAGTDSAQQLVHIIMTQDEWNAILRAIHHSVAFEKYFAEYAPLISFKNEVQAAVWD